MGRNGESICGCTCQRLHLSSVPDIVPHMQFRHAVLAARGPAFKIASNSCEDYPEGHLSVLNNMPPSCLPTLALNATTSFFLRQACSNIAMVYRHRFLLPLHVFDLKD